MANRATITYNGSTISTEDRDGSFSVTYNGSTIATIGAGQTKTLNCANQVMKTNVVVGGKTLNCAKYKMATNVVIAVTSLFPSSPSSYNLISKYTSAQTWTAPEDGWFQIEVIGASGTGGEGQSYAYGSLIKAGGSGGGGGGGGRAISRVGLKKGDKITLSPGGVGSTTSATIDSSYSNTYDHTLQVTSGGNGGSPNISASGASVSIANGAGGSGGVASGGNHSNENGPNGGTGTSGTSISSAPAAGVGGSGWTTGGNGGTGYTSSGTWIGGTWNYHAGASGTAGYINIYRGNTNT